jgi:hypothetical protein
VCGDYYKNKRNAGMGPIRVGEKFEISEDLYMLVLSANFKKNILANHRKEADNNLNALNAIVAAEV